MERLPSKMGWEIVEEAWPDFKGKCFKNRPRNLVEMLSSAVRKYPDSEGFICDHERLTFAQFDLITNGIAAGLRRTGVGPGDRVSLLLSISNDFMLCFFAVIKLNAIAVPLNTRFKGEELAYEINDSESKVVIAGEEYWEQFNPARSRLKTVEKIFFNGADCPSGAVPFRELREYPAEQPIEAVPQETDSTAIMYTSGTTGKPKGAILHHRGMIASAMHASDFFQFRQGDKMICCVPLFHITGLAVTALSAIFSGIPCVYLRTFKVKTFLETMAAEKVTAFISVINILWLMVNHADFGNYDFSSFRCAGVGGSPATEEMISGIRARLPRLNVSVGYGLTESHGFETSTPYEDAVRKISAVGKLVPLLDAKIVDDNGGELPVGSVGEIILRSLMTTKGYWKNDEATKAAIVDGWLHTGDIGKLDDEGFLYILDRKKDMINRGGEKIYCIEVENVIMNCPKVLEVAVVGVPDRVLGEQVKAYVALKPGQSAEEEEIKDYCIAALADYKAPKYVEFVESLPRNPAGKVIKADLRYVPERR
jgi:acyl-CoA synthetase (AMP-forming)/AMP-acid ligase II